MVGCCADEGTVGAGFAELVGGCAGSAGRGFNVTTMPGCKGGKEGSGVAGGFVAVAGVVAGGNVCASPDAGLT